MLTYEIDEMTGVMEITIDGRVSNDAFEEISSELERLIVQHGKARIIEVIKDIGMIEPVALWEDIKFSLRHLNDFSRVAVVTDKAWIEIAAKVFTPILPYEVANFELHEIEAARKWIVDVNP